MATPINAESALVLLEQGNERFRGDIGSGAGRDAARRRALVDNQCPFATILCCSDSRVTPEFVFDTGLGDLFVVRVAGNVANTSSIGSVEYAVAELGTRLVVVLAHENCGAVGAVRSEALDDQDRDRPDNLNHLLSHIRPAFTAHRDMLDDRLEKNNAALSAARLLSESAIIRTAVAEKGVRIITALYRLASGAVDFDCIDG